MGSTDQSQRDYAKECPLRMASVEPSILGLGGG